MDFKQETSENKRLNVVMGSQSNPINNKNGEVISSPILPRKTANRLYGGYNQSQRFFDYQNNSTDSLEVIYEFCAEAKMKNSVDDLYCYFHNLAVSKLGFGFTAIGLVNAQSRCINLKLLDRVGNVFSSRILLSEMQNPIVQAFENKVQLNVNNIDFLNIPYLDNSPGLIMPMVIQGQSVGIIIAGSQVPNEQNNAIATVLTDYLSLFIINKQLGEMVNQNSDVDALTGLKNHRGFQESLRSEIVKAEKEQKPVSVVIFDINNISQVNREFGHAKGDEIIKLISSKIKQNIRSMDTAGRYGGDEIAVILPDLDNSEACYIAEYLNYTLSCCYVDDVGPVKVSVGVATYPMSAKDQEKLLILAEQAMYISKNKGSKNGMSSLISAQNINFWNNMALDSFAAVLAKRHSQLGINFEDEIVKKFHSEEDKFSSNTHMLDVVTSLAGAIDAKDTYTRGHSQSVSRYAEALARAVNLPDAEVERVKLGALLHDVGKIGIPESILGKQAQLSDEEWEIMKQHPGIGVKKVLGPIDSLKDLIPMVEHHHEHWDGSGYPAGLKGDEIPIGARIVAIADSFHALISDRPYRKGLSVDKAIEILKVGAGIQWDKDLVRKFIILAPSLCTTV